MTDTAEAKLLALIGAAVVSRSEPWGTRQPHYEGTDDLVVTTNRGEVIATLPTCVARLLALAPGLAAGVGLARALRAQRDKAKWAWQFLAAIASDGHNRKHDGRAVALAECPEAPCPSWREDLQSYQDAIADTEAALARWDEALEGL